MSNALPPDDYLLAFLREAHRLYEDAMKTATVMEYSVWRYCSRAKFVENAWPYDIPNAATYVVIGAALTYVIERGAKMEDAIRAAKRREKRTRHWLSGQAIKRWERNHGIGDNR